MRSYGGKSAAASRGRPGAGSLACDRFGPSGGRIGGALHFHKKSPKLVFFQGGNNIPWAKSDFEGTVSLWLRLNPTEDLPEGYVDPLQITDKKWNDAAFFVDFTKESPRQFRLKPARLLPIPRASPVSHACPGTASCRPAIRPKAGGRAQEKQCNNKRTRRSPRNPWAYAPS